jgi:hypothetical protein
VTSAYTTAINKRYKGSYNEKSSAGPKVSQNNIVDYFLVKITVRVFEANFLGVYYALADYYEVSAKLKVRKDDGSSDSNYKLPNLYPSKSVYLDKRNFKAK